MSTDIKLIIAGIILSIIALGPLLQAILSLLNRVNGARISGPPLQSRLMRMLSLILLVGIVISAIGYIMDYVNGRSTNVALAEARSILTFAVLLGLCAYAALLAMYFPHLPPQ